MSKGYVDADGHVMEQGKETEEEFNNFIVEPFKATGYKGFRQLMPSLDRFHTPRINKKPGTFDNAVGPQQWLQFLEKTGLEYAALYPTAGLAFGQIVIPEWAVAYAKTYNNWLYEKYVRLSSRFKGVALIPMQDVSAAVVELRRAVKELGMVGAMIPSNGLVKHISAKDYWPIYEEAEKLDCTLAIHGGCYGDLGFNSFTVFSGTAALGMPFPLAIAMTGLIIDGVLDAFPRLRIGFLEGGTSWIPLVIDRLEREVEYGELLRRVKKKPEDYFRSGRIFVGCEGNEKSLAYAIERVGHEPFMFASDFPHEITMDDCMGEINEILERQDIKDEHKTAILGGNARRFYRI